MKDQLRRKRNLKDQEVYFGEDDIILAGYRLSPVHRIPKHIKMMQELDWYLYTGYDVYLLRLRNSAGLTNSITVCPADKICPIIYIVCETQLNSRNIFVTLEKVLAQLEYFGIPKIKNPKQQITIPFQIDSKIE